MQSDPEDSFGLVLVGGGVCDSGGGGVDGKKCRSKRKVEKLRGGRRIEVSAPLQGSKSMGRLDGLKQVNLFFSHLKYTCLNFKMVT